MKGILMEIFIKVSSPRIKHTDEVSIIGKMERYMMVNGFMAKSMVMVCGLELKVIATSENGEIAKRKEEESISGKMVIDMKVNLLQVSKKATVVTHSEMGTAILGSTKQENLMVLDNINGTMVAITLVTLRTESSMVKESGERTIYLIVTSMKEII